MKTILKINDRDYEVEIKAKFAENLNNSPKALADVTRWLEARLWESSREIRNYTYLYQEVTDYADRLHRFNVMQPLDYKTNF